MANIEEEMRLELHHLLNPENLTDESLISILQQRRVVIDDVNRITREDLVELFHRTVTPQPQRVMRNNRVGRALKSRQEKIASRKPKCVQAPSLLTAAKSTASTAQCSPQRGGLVMSANVSQGSGFRLKPPPIVLNKKNRIAKLKATVEIKQDNTHPNGKIKIKSPSSSLASLSSLSSPSSSSRCIKSPTVTSPKTNTNLPVKRPSQQTEQNPVDGSCSPKKKKLTKITWP